MTDGTVEDHWEHAPCGQIIAEPDGRIIRVNATLLRWLGYGPNTLCGKPFTDLLTVSGRILYDTHFGPLLNMGGDLNGVTVDVVTADGTRLPMFLTANVKSDADQKPELLRISVVDAADRRAYEVDLLQARQQAEKEQARVRKFVETLRNSLLPPVLSPPTGLEAAEYYNTASVDDVGGDFYDLFPLSRTTWGFFLGDVSGKGVDAAVVTGLTRYTLRAAAVYDDDPVEVLHNLNTVLSQELGGELNRFCTLIYGKLSRCDNGFDVHLASGGHPPPLLFYADGSSYYVDTIGGQAVGITNEPHFVASQFVLAPGDTLVLYTDGLTEASTGVGRERYDDEGALLRFAKAHSPTTASAIVDAVSGLLEGLGSGVEDDTAVLALGVPSETSSSLRPLAGPNLH
ncbi:MAG: SpoIIE family protein phosphatase [Mycobacterium sp.]